jgi:hypothetical protein
LKLISSLPLAAVHALPFDDPDTFAASIRSFAAHGVGGRASA